MAGNHLKSETLHKLWESLDYMGPKNEGKSKNIRREMQEVM
jgi:hypothetical protein